MTAVAVTFDGTRVNASDANTNWGKINAGGGAPAAEAPAPAPVDLIERVRAEPVGT